jgi:tRNA(Ile)-lysidine synthase
MGIKMRRSKPVLTSRQKQAVVVAAVSGGPDSVYLLEKLVRGKTRGVVIGHVNYGARGKESEKDQALVEDIAERLRIDIGIHKSKLPGRIAGFEESARDIRRGFLKRLQEDSGGKIIAMGHTADDQVETVLMRFFEGAGISGLKGIPRETDYGIVRPLLDLWKEDIVAFLEKRRIPYRVDRSNEDTRFERNWIRHVVIPLLEKRYGKAVKKRIFAMGERFRELDGYLDAEAARWIRRNVRVTPRSVTGRGNRTEPPSASTVGTSSASVEIRRKTYSRLPTALRVKILQKICFGHAGASPNERLLQGLDRVVRAGGPSAEVTVGKGWKLVNRYEEARLVPAGMPGESLPCLLRTESAGKVTPARAKRVAARGDAEVFDAAGLRLPLSVRPLRPGDRILPFGMTVEKKVKEILIDRKIPRGDRWGRPAVCDAEGAILWVPGVVRSAHAPVTPATRCAKIIRHLT